MRRFLALLAALVLTASLASASVAAGPESRVNRMVGNFDFLDWDGSVAGHVVVNYTQSSDGRWVPGTLDVTWVPDARFPYSQPPSGAKQSHTVLIAAWFGPNATVDGVVETGTTGSMCDFGAPGNATCHDFTVVIEEYGDGNNLIAFGFPDWENSPAEWYPIGAGAFALTYAGPTS